MVKEIQIEKEEGNLVIINGLVVNIRQLDFYLNFIVYKYPIE